MHGPPAAPPPSTTAPVQWSVDPSAGVVSSRLLQVAHGAVLLCLATMLSGIERFFAFWSTSLHYGFDAFAIIAVATSFMGRRQWRSFLLTTAPGLMFVLAYFVWGLLVSPDESSLQSRTVSAMILAALTMSTLSVGFHDRDTLRRFADVCCCVAIFTFAMMLYELGTPDPEEWFKGMPDRVAKRLGGGFGTLAFDDWANHPALNILYVNTFKRVDA